LTSIDPIGYENPTVLANVYRIILRETGSILLLASISTAAQDPRGVLVLDSFDKGFAPYLCLNTIAVCLSR
jgi:hypothetical protein